MCLGHFQETGVRFSAILSAQIYSDPRLLGGDQSDLIAIFEQLVDDTVHQCLK
ncbi:hypothetical protein FB004_102316 [Sinorhizobium medicae]|nr:hypothetical protein FB006_104323 [Sinorhizobium medicae]TWA27342.1 hypothetical protein FB004_102316 [Sinorhizobium medicae]TWA30627.1 hypothetical protein FB007_11785 [Sinorhizobium medicae]TWA43585.1 hypothetical protein FB009_102354 [Sinorhizobium medicae]TWA45500.1 hypothetical protein FB005_10585 [Sinorhizobium medicae]